MNIKDRITKMTEQWFLSEGALFAVTCTHTFEENTQMHCPVRCGGRKIQYNPLYCDQMSDKAFEEAFRNEAVRILLKHPYERRPEGCDRVSTATGSNLVIGDHFAKGTSLNGIETPEDYELDKGQCYEWYAREIQKRRPPMPSEGMNGGSGGNGSGDGSGNGNGGQQASQDQAKADLSELWDEDPLAVAQINKAIEGIQSWGTLPGSLVGEIQASTKAKVNWRNILAGFRASVITSTTRLTRMRPNRRTGFQNMGTARDYHTRLLVALDTSGSVSDESLSHFFGIINRSFNAGVFSIDVLQFDCGVQKVETFNRKKKTFTVSGRGGTDFQEPVDYAFDHDYDGLVVLTDGYAPAPTIPAGSTKIMWVCTDKNSYEHNKEWMLKCGRACTIELN